MLPDLIQAGFQHVYYLPLAADLHFPDIPHDKRFQVLRDRITYVGGTFTRMVDHFHSESFEQLYKEWNPDFTAEKQANGRVVLADHFQTCRDRFPTSDEFRRFMAYVVFSETRRYRTGRLALLQDMPLSVFGTSNWKKFLPEDQVLERINYLKQTPDVYSNSAINLSFSSFQGETAVNQRHFDVPLCNGFLLTDWQEALDEHFDVPEEVVHFRDDDELKDKTRYYLEHPTARHAVIKKARERILKEHLIEHRVDFMLQTLEGIFAR